MPISKAQPSLVDPLADADTRLSAPTTSLLRGPLVVALVYDGLCTFEYGIVTEVFGLARPELGADWYRFASCAIDEGPLRAHGGLVFTTQHTSNLIEDADIIVIPGWKGADVAVPEALSQRLRRAHERGARLASICSGAFVLASTGLLDGGTATTHWRYADALRRRHPHIEVDHRSLYRAHNRIFTSAGSAAGIDLLIEIVRQDYGAATANSVARRLVIAAHRTGGQAQFLERSVPLRPTATVAPLLDQVRTNLAASWTVDGMAQQCRMSKRTFLRRFHEATGATPGEWLLVERLALAKQLLCQEKSQIDQIAAAVGFGSTHTLRHHFRTKLGLSPSEFRKHFMRELAA